MSYRYDVFISYSHVNKEWVRCELLPCLEAAGLRVCIDYRDFAIGLPVISNIERAVDDSRHTLVLLTPGYVASEWCELEILLVGTGDPAGRRRRLLPVLLESCSLPKRIDALTHADFTRLDDRAEELDRLLKQLLALTAPPKPPVEDASPFIAGPPVAHPRYFFGQEKSLKRLFEVLKGRQLQNAVVIGPRRSGKTSLLLHLRNLITTSVNAPDQLRPGQRADWLPQPEQYRWIFVDFQNPRLGRQEVLLRYFLESLGLPAPTPCDLESFLEVASRHLRTPTVVLLDEIDVALQRYSELDNYFWEGLRSLATTQVEGNLSFVLAGNVLPTQLARDSGIGSPFFNIFKRIVELKALDEQDARELIASSPIPFHLSDVEWILDQSECWPILLQILCGERLIALEEGASDDAWREESLRQIEPFQHLLAG